MLNDLATLSEKEISCCDQIWQMKGNNMELLIYKNVNQTKYVFTLSEMISTDER